MNKAPAAVNVFLGILMFIICIPSFNGSISPNKYAGFRMKKAYESEENWYKINRYGAQQQMLWASGIFLTGIGCLFVSERFLKNRIIFWVLLIGPCFVGIIIPSLQTIAFAKGL